MTEAAPRKWTIEEFFAWQERQPQRYELVDGFPTRMMAGAKKCTMTSSSTCWRNCATNSEVEVVGRSQATAASRRNPDKSVVLTSASTADAGTPTPRKPHRLASLWR